jgi:dTMP kinase
LLEKFFEEKGFKVILTREPGGTVISEEIRQIILNKEYTNKTHMTDALLYAAARAQHDQEFIRPNIKAGNIVICDRYVDSSIVYQGYARGLGVEKIEAINDYAINGLTPNLTILLDLSSEEGITRKKSQKELDRLEMEKNDFHKKVSEGYRMLAKKYSNRIISIDAMKTVDEIHKEIINKIISLIN